jgi:hypothetical protein
MRPEDARPMAARITNTFRLTPPASEWAAALADEVRAPATADAAYRRLRSQVEGALSIARFLRECREVERELSQERHASAIRCATCAGEGWVACLDERRHGVGCVQYLGLACHCHAVVRCPDCSSGHPRPASAFETAPVALDDYLRRHPDSGLR